MKTAMHSLTHPRILRRLERTVEHRRADYAQACQTLRAHLTDVLERLIRVRAAVTTDSHRDLLGRLIGGCADLLDEVNRFREEMPSDATLAILAARAGEIGNALARALVPNWRVILS